MPNPNDATGEQPLGPLGLEDHLFEDNDTQEGSTSKTAEEQLLSEIDSEESTEDNKTDDTEDVDSDEEESEPESEDEGEEDESKTAKTYRLGNQEFATAEDAIREATRIIGRNAQLAGDLHAKETETSRLQTALQEALQANQEWQEYYASLEAGNPGVKPTEKPLDPDEFAARVEERVTQREQARAAKAQNETEINVLFALPSFREVVNDVRNLADKINPFTNKLFTPFEAYDLAVARHGIANERTRVAPPKAAETTKAKKIDRTQIKKAAALPTNGGASASGKPSQGGRDFADELLSEQILF